MKKLFLLIFLAACGQEHVDFNYKVYYKDSIIYCYNRNPERITRNPIDVKLYHVTGHDKYKDLVLYDTFRVEPGPYQMPIQGTTLIETVNQFGAIDRYCYCKNS